MTLVRDLRDKTLNLLVPQSWTSQSSELRNKGVVKALRVWWFVRAAQAKALTKEYKGTFSKVREMFYVMIMVVVTKLQTLVKT